MSYWRFVVKDMGYAEMGWSNYGVYLKRMEEGYFGLCGQQEALKPGDRVVFYVGVDGHSGNNPPQNAPEKAFVGTATLASSCAKETPQERTHYDHPFLKEKKTHYRVYLRDVEVWDTPKEADAKLRKSLELFNRDDARNWGQYVRGEVRKISEVDFHTICSWPQQGSHLSRVAPSNAAPEGWLSVSEAAKYLNVSSRTIYGWVHGGFLTGHTTPQGGLLRFRKADLDHCLTRVGALKEEALSGADDPVLTELWNNEMDAAYDRL